MFLKKRGISRRKGCGKRKGWLIHIFALCLLNFRGVQNGCHQDFKYLMVSIHFFIKWESNERFMPDKLQSLEENVLIFFYFGKFHRKAPVLESLFNKAAYLEVCNFIKKRFQKNF